MVLTRSAAKKSPAPQKYAKVEEMPKGKGKSKAGEPTQIKAIKNSKDEEYSSSESEPEKSPESSSSEEQYKSKAKKSVPKKNIIKNKKEKSPSVSEESSPDLAAPKSKKKTEKPVAIKPKKRKDSSSSYDSSSESPVPKKKNSKNTIPAKRAIKPKAKPKQKSPSPELDKKPNKRSDSPPPLPPSPELKKKKSPSPPSDVKKEPEPSKKKSPSSPLDDTKKPEPAKKKSPSPEPPKKEDAPKEEQKIVTTIRKGRAAVDSFCPKAKDCHVYDDGTKVWSSTLNQTDVKTNANKFYINQLLQSDSNAKQFFVWNRWGRVGYDGQNALKGPWTELDRAKSDYQKKLIDKTKGGYVELEICYDDEEKSEDVEEKTQKNEKVEEKEVASKLDKRIQDLIKLIFDLNAMNNVLAEMQYDAKKMPLGKLSTNNLKQGLEILKQIEAVLDNRENGSLEGLTSKFFSFIPHDFGFRNVSYYIINSKQRLHEKIAMIEALTDMKIATNIIEAKVTGSPVDQHYLKLNCDITPIEKNDPTFVLLSDYVSNTHAKTHNSYGLTIIEIFRLHKVEEDERFTKDIGNNMLLWHGSRLTNWAGILSQGLRIAPPEAPVSGYMFGKGVYFADMVSKSANYCFTNRENNIGIMLLCEVAVGIPCEKMTADYNAANLPPGTNSTKGCGRNAPPPSTYIDFEGCKVPIGNGEETGVNGSLLYNEYIVYDVKQVKMKFLFKMRFDYKFS